MAKTDTNRETTNVIFDPEVSSEIISKAIEQSAFMQLAGRMSIAGNGKKYQTITSDPEPTWVGETEGIGKGKFGYGTKTVMPYKMGLIVPFSNEFRRDKKALYDECFSRVPRLFARKFDKTVMGEIAPGENFDVLGGAQKVSILPAAGTDVYHQFLAAEAAISSADGIMGGIALAPQGKSIVLGATDTTGRPLFTAGVGSHTVGDILGAKTTVAKGVYVPGAAGTPAVVGVAGDFDECSWGAVSAIHGSVSEEATITVDGEQVNLWEKEMFAIRFTVELAFMVRDVNKFALLTGATPTE